MRRSKVEIYVHYVWGTWQREAFITPELERTIHRTIEAEARKLGCVVLALDGTSDHVHSVLKLPATVCPADLAKQMKGVSSSVARDVLNGRQPFRWQEGYGVFSLSRTHVKAACRYVRNQKRRHAANDLWPEWEETDEEVERT